MSDMPIVSQHEDDLNRSGEREGMSPEGTATQGGSPRFFRLVPNTSKRVSISVAMAPSEAGEQAGEGERRAEEEEQDLERGREDGQQEEGGVEAVRDEFDEVEDLDIPDDDNNAIRNVGTVKNAMLMRCISLCKALIVKAPNLQQILVGKNYIQKTGVTALCELLEKMKSMNTLVVNHNPLGDSAKSIAHLLPQCFGLATLLLDGNPQVGLEGVQLIKAAAVRCSTLKTCSLPALPDANTAQGGGAGVGSSAYNSFSGVPKDSSAEDSGTSRERGAHTSEESPGSGVPGPMTSQSRTDTLQTESKSLMEKASGQAEVLSSVEVA
uniref:Uncharacterized protein n=1 Tax=Chromera velia CCMP2878 TaxID=1169474 RepID=A0A0G4FYA0_9ALVE|eukprot:Cvel_3886.t1-p1 / transcript=Cvel_3886.t1 / gene=Cvel_3886 / organism=Chromera_velia_CCMP2878 / gene_product=hypothetical protein / transcript_product=hypothetical protein / location=Cvel_scaffold164:86609-94917(+) / protein_length=323 / sequence_SO=supercontig / SO=protein_coding / is_pseudo=false